MEQIDLKEVWKIALAQIEVKVDSPAHFKTWFSSTELLNIEGKRAKIGVKNSYTSDWLRRKHIDTIKKTLDHITKNDLVIEFEISKELANQETPKVTKKESEYSAPILNMQDGLSPDFNTLISQANLNPSYNFSNFVVGPSNRLAHAASIAVAENPGKTYNPLFIYGQTGLGKTHLAQSVGQKILEKSQSKRILYIASETFLNEMVNAIKTGKTKEFRNKHRFLDLIIIDDIQMISKWEQTQDELFNTFNALYNKNKQIILISDRPPQKIHNLEARLKSRFQGGMVVMVENPDYETKLAILEQKAKQNNIHLPTYMLEYIAKNVSQSIRELEGSLKQVALYNDVKQSDLTIPEIANILGTDELSKRDKTKPRDLVKLVCKELRVTSKDLLGRSRKSDIAFARQVAMFLLREDFGFKLEEIADLLNRKDHTTVMHGVDKIKSKMALDKGFEEQIQGIRSQY
ncbi:chromosomal replication initiator protein DnaA [Candidatus Dojkabacteria bacterium]|nr:chromosomal replication initiator protein DnaA [Candidatus Dojkabacteria bacterium]